VVAMRRVVILVALALLPALVGCTLSEQCRNAGPPSSAANQACVNRILEEQNLLQNQRDRWDLRGRDAG
jgi:hypothetical protein